MSRVGGVRVARRATLIASWLAATLAPALAQEVDHSKMDHSKADPPTVDHSKMDHSRMDHSTEAPPLPPPPEAATLPREPIPEPTAADRAAAFPEVDGHAAHDLAWHSYFLVDQLETWDADASGGVLGWETSGWLGGDIHRAWLRTEGELLDGAVESARLELLAGRSVSPWWDLVLGLRHDLGEAPSQTFAAIGVQGLAPQKIELQATAYLGQGGRTALRVEAEYDTLLSSRWILQWQLEAEAFGKDDVERGIGSGVASAEAGLRLRYEHSRRVAPYLGLVHERSFGRTADFRRAEGEASADTRVVLGLRFWF